MCRDMEKKKSKQNNPYCRCVFTASRTFSKNLSNIHTLNFKTGGFDMVDAFNSRNLSSISLNLENRDLFWDPIKNVALTSLIQTGIPVGSNSFVCWEKRVMASVFLGGSPTD